MLKFFNSLFGRVVIALVAGIVIGALFPHFAQSLRPLGDPGLGGSAQEKMVSR